MGRIYLLQVEALTDIKKLMDMMEEAKKANNQNSEWVIKAEEQLKEAERNLEARMEKTKEDLIKYCKRGSILRQSSPYWYYA